MWQSCGGVSRAILALTIYKTQKRVKRQLRFDKGVAKGCSLQVKRCLRSVFKACSALVVVCGGCAVVYYGKVLH